MPQLPSSVSLSCPPLLDIQATDEMEAIRMTAGLLAANPLVTDSTAFLDAVLERQRINPPLLGKQIALPHARTPAVKDMVFAAARSLTPIPFGEQQEPVQLIFMFGVPPHKISEYLAAMAGLVRRLKSPGVIDSLLSTESADDFSELLK
ncbi:PTS sugar transporter subunit IIA [Luteolibacter pohnpeiensis]|uniref:PTS sugar transporter subunit IIA n=1 Tax=Luteolibacter pohnpeiensis TaxID=454153 RepID=A0A934VSN6_9BACT|nr:PTS sugar transporter subunit IIA [Luteolibacter pohnpeiensis]MBK1884511.1 PTS sugar transporter subunit IIA [Luteolibacter pohnpeiensis]